MGTETSFRYSFETFMEVFIYARKLQKCSFRDLRKEDYCCY